LGERLKEQAACREEAEKAHLAAKRPVGKPKKSNEVPSAILIPVQASGQQPAARMGGSKGMRQQLRRRGWMQAKNHPLQRRKGKVTQTGLSSICGLSLNKL